MNDLYATEESPPLPEFQPHAVCAGNIEEHWYRLQIVQHFESTNTCVAKYLDYGGYCEIETNQLRQIRFDCVSLPFQAIECKLADIKPNGMYVWGVWWWAKQIILFFIFLFQFVSIDLDVC